MDQGIGSWVRGRAALAPERVALVEHERSVTYGEFDERTNRTARMLLGTRRASR